MTFNFRRETHREGVCHVPGDAPPVQQEGGAACGVAGEVVLSLQAQTGPGPDDLGSHRRHCTVVKLGGH